MIEILRECLRTTGNWTTFAIELGLSDQLDWNFVLLIYYKYL